MCCECDCEVVCAECDCEVGCAVSVTVRWGVL